ncbi:MAG: hypothetical protein OCD02_15995 [Spirochaetaceae bacterium]
MKKILITGLFIFISINVNALNSGFNFTIIPGVNLYPNQEITYISTGFISSEVNQLDGLQFGPVYSVSANKVDGLQASGVFNVAGGNVDGFQAAGVFNTAENVDGFQAGGVFNISDDIDGFQAGGVFNITQKVDGFQAAGVFNISEDIDGFQAAGVFNQSDDLIGLQSAGVWNTADDVIGVQVAGVINSAKNVNGSQISVINTATGGKNLQIGIINVVTDNSSRATPIGLLNFYADGIFEVSAWMDTREYIYQGLETGSKHFYTLHYTGTKEENFKELEGRIFGTAFGVRSDLLFLNFDLTAGGKFIYYSDTEDDCFAESFSVWTPDVKASLGLELGALTLFAGVDADLKIDKYNQDSDFFIGNDSIKLSDSLDLHYTFFAGLKLNFI